MTSPAQRLAALPPELRRTVLHGFTAEQIAALHYAWTALWARPEQLMPPGEWRCWLYLAGRGAGKTRSAAEAIRAAVESGEHREIGVIAPTAEALRRVCVARVRLVSSLCTRPPSGQSLRCPWAG